MLASSLFLSQTLRLRIALGWWGEEPESGALDQPDEDLNATDDAHASEQPKSATWWVKSCYHIWSINPYHH